VPALDQLPPDAQRLAKFSLVGISNTLVSFASYAVLIALDVEYALAGAIAWTLGVLNGYTWNRIWTVAASERRGDAGG
jgi:putative flippase GtrA